MDELFLTTNPMYQRNCLKCRKAFKTHGRYKRLCSRCNKDNMNVYEKKICRVLGSTFSASDKDSD